MPREFFKRLSPSRRQLTEKRWLRPLARWLDYPDLWAIRRRAVAPGAALGLFWLWIPIPGHALAAAASAIALRVNLPVAIIMTFIINPLTILPMYYGAYRFGASLLGVSAPDMTAPDSLQWFSERLGAIWQPLLAGSVLLGLASAAVGYLVIDVAWRSRVAQYMARRRKRRQRN